MSDYPKIQPEISQPISENLQKLADLFPAAVKDGELDIEALREELGDFAEIQPGDEKYELNWVGKQAAKKKTFEPLLGKTLALKDDGENEDTTENLYIEGDNLEALKLLRQNYYGEVKMIYIDPPYNTGNDFVYSDKFSISGEVSDEEEGSIAETGERLRKNDKTSNRYHARWLDMMYPRLKLARDLLKEDGVLFVSIDENEVANIEKLSNEIFGADNYIATLPVIMNLKGNADAFGFSETHEFVVAVAKNKSLCKLNEFAVDETVLDKEWDEDEHGLYKRADTLRRTGQDAARERRPKGWFPVFISATNKVYITDDDKPLSKEDQVLLPVTVNNEELSWSWSKAKIRNEPHNLIVVNGRNGKNIYKKQRPQLGELPTSKPKSLLYKPEYSTSTATTHLKSLLDGKFFTSPKPMPFIKDLLIIGSDYSAIVIDFFSGSATSAHAVMQLNAEDGGNRKHIMVQLPEVCGEKSEAAKANYQTIAEIGKERIRRAGEKIKAELIEKAKIASEEEKAGNPNLADPDSLDIGFKSFRIEDTKINWLKKDLRGEDIVAEAGLTTADALDFVPGFTDTDVVYELMLRQSNIPLTLPITQPIDGSERTYLYGDSYLICLEESISKELVEQLAALEPTPLKYFFRDSAFGTDIAFKDETFRRLNAEIAKNTADQADAYTVEFI